MNQLVTILKRLRDTLFPSAMDWTPIEVAMKDFFSRIGIKGIIYFIVIIILNSLYGLLLVKMSMTIELGGYYARLAFTLLPLATALAYGKSRDRQIVFLLPLNREHRAVLSWVRLTLIPLLAVMISIVNSMAISAMLCYPQSVFTDLRNTFITIFSIVFSYQLIMIIAYANEFFIKERKKSKSMSIFAYVIMFFLYCFIEKAIYPYCHLLLGQQKHPLAIAFPIILVLLFLTYRIQLLSSNKPLYTTKNVLKQSILRGSATTMPMRSVASILTRDYLVTIFVYTAFTIAVIWLTVANDSFVPAIFLTFFSAFIFWAIPPKRFHPANARELRMLPLKKWKPIWISSWAAGIKITAYIIIALIISNILRNRIMTHAEPWMQNSFGWILLMSGLAILLRPVALLMELGSQKYIKLYGITAIEDLLSAIAIIPVYIASIPLVGYPNFGVFGPYSKTISRFSPQFLIFSIVFFGIALLLSTLLSRHLWNTSNFYRSASEME